jgi:two-component system response regulator DevR
MGRQVNARSTVAILDHRVLVRRGLAGMIADSGTHEVLFEAASSAELFSILEDLKRHDRGLPDVVILDLLMPEDDGLDVLTQLTGRFPSCAPFVITDSTDPSHMRLAFEHGARAYALRDVSAAAIATALEALHANRHFVGPAMVSHLIRTFVTGAAHHPLDALTEREQDVLRLASLQFTNREIAERLSISEHTVKTHLWNACEKLGVKTRYEAVSIAIQAGMVLKPRLLPLAGQSSQAVNAPPIAATHSRGR